MGLDRHDAQPSSCRICASPVVEIVDFGSQPVSNGFLRPEDAGSESYFRLAAGVCEGCAMVQLLEEVPRDTMFHEGYPYRSSESSVMVKHFEQFARRLMETELTGADDLVVDIGSNDGILLAPMAEAGVRHLGVDASQGAVAASREKGVRARVDFFDEDTAQDIARAEGPARVIFSANTFSHIAYLDSVMAGIDTLLADDGVFVFEDRYLGDIIANTAFDQIYDEHFYLFGVHSVSAMVRRYGFELVDAERIAVHGGAVRYWVARPGARRPTAGLAELVAEESERGLVDPSSLTGFGQQVEKVCADFVGLLDRLREEGRSVAGYGATSKSATIINYCGLGPSYIRYISDTTKEKQGRLTPGGHIPVAPRECFSDPYPEYAVLFAWNHADEILAKEKEFRENGGRWIVYVPEVRVI